MATTRLAFSARSGLVAPILARLAIGTAIAVAGPGTTAIAANADGPLHWVQAGPSAGAGARGERLPGENSQSEPAEPNRGDLRQRPDRPAPGREDGNQADEDGPGCPYEKRPLELLV